MESLNLGILAHVDAGKTTLTERLLYAAGVIDAVGSVDKGNTQTDSLALEQKRGITIKSAVVAFVIQDIAINLIDTPGHPDFIAEVERVLSVLDGAVLVISAVEGVQPQTRILMRTLQRLRIPTLIFVNKIDRPGAKYEGVLQRISERLTPRIVPMGDTTLLGTHGAEFMPYALTDRTFTAQLADLLSAQDDGLLTAYLDDETTLPYTRLRYELAFQTKQAMVHPVFFGSAITGAGVVPLMEGIAELLPTAQGDANDPVSGTVFKIERGSAGDKIAFVRLFSGTLRTRDRVQIRSEERKITSIRVLESGSVIQRANVMAGEIGKLSGLGEVQIGDLLGTAQRTTDAHYFASPTLETVIVAANPGDKDALHVALSQLAEQDPLINLRQDDLRGEMFLSLYGEVQKEVIAETLANEFGITVAFRETTTICVERPIGTGHAVEVIGKADNPFHATIGLRTDPAPSNTGIEFRLEVQLGSLPLAFFRAVEASVHETLQQGLHGWQVKDCSVSMTHSGYWAPSSTAGDFRGLTPLIVMAALRQAGTKVYEPIHHFQLEIPTDTLGRTLALLGELQAIPQVPNMQASWCSLEGEIPAVRVHELQQQLPALTHGEGTVECVFDSYRAVRGTIPRRLRTDNNPLDRKEYLLHVVRRA